MKRLVWTDEMVDYLKEIAPGNHIDDTTARLNEKFKTNLTDKQVKYKIGNERILIGRNKPYRSKLLTKEQYEYFLNIQEGMLSYDVAEMINNKFGTEITHKQVQYLRMNSGVKANKHFGFVSKLYVHPFKGKRIINSGQFKKGDQPPHTLPLYSERRDVNGIKIKVGKDKGYRGWIQKSVYVWEQAHGKIPDTHTIVYLDGDKYNCNLENLQIVKKDVALEMTRRGLRFDNPILTEHGIKVATLSAKYWERKRELSKRELKDSTENLNDIKTK